MHMYPVLSMLGRQRFLLLDFITTPFERAFKRLDADIIKAYELDVEELLKFTTNGNNKR